MSDPDHWKWANEVLYRMCRESPTHKEIDVVVGKVWLIGRTYSASIERKAGPNMIRGENFYTTRVAPMIIDSDIDTWLDSTKSISRVTAENMSSVLDVHKKVTGLFKAISGIDKRSLASKYLHFHQPNAFFIYDSIANKEIRKRCNKQNFSAPKGWDNEYSSFVVRCLSYRDKVFEPRLSRPSTPRELDQDLLEY